MRWIQTHALLVTILSVTAHGSQQPNDATFLIQTRAAAEAPEFALDRGALDKPFDGIGAVSGGGATTLLLPQYPEPARSEILDYLFKPNFGASLQLLKVEIGGDAMSTDGSESSHMHADGQTNFQSGYEWWLMKEAKKRNPDIKLYGLAWAFPGWVADQTDDPFVSPELPVKYLLTWVQGAKKEHGLDIEYLGIWNERAADSAFVKLLRRRLDQAGFRGVRIVVKDGDAGICRDLAADAAYREAVHAVALHYPDDRSDFTSCHRLGLPVWASEESSSFDDLNGAACWARVMNAHWVLNSMTSNMMWNLVGSYYHGTDWYASSIMTANQPWSGHYEVNPVIWATAHVTQFVDVGWRFLRHNQGSGKLLKGGFYTTYVDPRNRSSFTLNVVKISRSHAACTRPEIGNYATEAETVTFRLADELEAPEELQVWYSYLEAPDESRATLFEKRPSIRVVNRLFTLEVPVGALFTVTTRRDRGSKGSFPNQAQSSPSFPLPHFDDLQSAPAFQDAALLADQIGVFEVHPSSDGLKSLRQMVPELPIGWCDPVNGWEVETGGPHTILGMREWQDVQVSVDFKLPPERPGMRTSSPDGACVAARADQMWKHGVFLCVAADGRFVLQRAGLPMQGPISNASSSKSTGFVRDAHSSPRYVAAKSRRKAFLQDARFQRDSFGEARVGTYASGHAKMEVRRGDWHRLTLRVQRSDPASPESLAEAWLDDEKLAGVSVRDRDTGFVGLGANGWFPIEFRNLNITKAPRGWETAPSCPRPQLGDLVNTHPCARNGLVREDQRWRLLPSFQIQHVGSGFCATNERGLVRLRDCDAANSDQLFKHDYTRIRNRAEHMNVPGKGVFGGANGLAVVGMTRRLNWKSWSYFPNTEQLRNQYVADDDSLGYPQCLSTCPLEPQR